MLISQKQREGGDETWVAGLVSLIREIGSPLGRSQRDSHDEIREGAAAAPVSAKKWQELNWSIPPRRATARPRRTSAVGY